MKVVKRRTGLRIQPFRLEQITDEQIEAGLEMKAIIHRGGDVYEEVAEADQTYMTRDMAAKPKTAKKKVIRRRKKTTSDEEE